MPSAPQAINAAKQRITPERLSSHKRGYNWRWRKEARERAKRSLCVGYDGKGSHVEGCKRMAECIDHIVKVEGDDDPLFWDERNLQPMSIACHSKKTVIQDGGLGCKPAKAAECIETVQC